MLQIDAVKVMIGALCLICFVVVLFYSVSLLGFVHPLHPIESYLLVGLSVMVVETILAFVFARGFVKFLIVGKGASDWLRRSARPVIVLVPTATVATAAILYINQTLDRGPTIERTLPVTRIYTEYSGTGSVTHFAAVPPPARWIFSTGMEDDIRLPWGKWRKLVPGQSMLTLRIHTGRFGLPWYDVASTTICTEPPV